MFWFTLCIRVCIDSTYTYRQRETMCDKKLHWSLLILTRVCLLQRLSHSIYGSSKTTQKLKIIIKTIRIEWEIGRSEGVCTTVRFHSSQSDKFWLLLNIFVHVYLHAISKPIQGVTPVWKNVLLVQETFKQILRNTNNKPGIK